MAAAAPALLAATVGPLTLLSWIVQLAYAIFLLEAINFWKPYAELEALPGPQLATGYAGCLSRCRRCGFRSWRST